MKVKEIRVGNTIIEIYDDYVDPNNTERIIKNIGTIRSHDMISARSDAEEGGAKMAI